MELWVKIALIAIALTAAFFAYRKLLSDYFKQKVSVEKFNAMKVREAKAPFAVETYIDKGMYCKDVSWLAQKNRGKHPCDLKKKINVRDYSEGCDYIIAKKGL